MSSTNDLYIKKVLQQQRTINELLKNCQGATIEIPEHETLFPATVKWLNNHHIDVKQVTDRDGRPICLIDISKMVTLEPRHEQLIIDQPLFSEENVR